MRCYCSDLVQKLSMSVYLDNPFKNTDTQVKLAKSKSVIRLLAVRSGFYRG